MPRIRYIKPDFFTDEHIAELSYEARLVFQGLWCMADKAGRLEDRPKHLKVMIMPFDKINMDKMLSILSTGSKPFIVRYSVDGKFYIQIINFLKHQKPHHTEKDSIIPEYKSEMGMGMGMGSEHEASAPLNNGYKTVNTPLKGKLDIHSKEFLEFWKIYPKKVSKDKAWESWKKKNPPFDRCLKTLAWQIVNDEWQKEDGKYIPMPATWLNQGRWKDIQSGYEEFTCECGNVGQIKKGFAGKLTCGKCKKIEAIQ